MDPAAAVKGENAFFPKKESAWRGAVRGFPVRSGDSAPPSCAASADPRRAEGCRGRLLLRVRRGGRLHAPSRRIHDGSNGGSGPGSRSSPFRMQKDSGSPAAAPPDGKFPMRPKRVRRARRSIGSGAGGGRSAIRWKAREIVRLRLRSSAAPGACAHAGHASRTLFANAASDIFLRRYSLPQLIYCSYISMQNMLLQIFYVNILYVGALRMLISLTPLLCLPPSSHHILNPDPIFPPSHKENT